MYLCCTEVETENDGGVGGGGEGEASELIMGVIH